MNLIQEALGSIPGLVTTKVAMEAAGIKDQTEEEITIYAKIGNMEGLSQASLVLQQEQAEIKTKTGKIRIRKIIQNGRLPVYELTTKRPISMQGVAKNRERTKKINEEIYDLFMDVCETFMSKTRYVFKAENLRIKRGDMEANIKTNDLAFEVDVFTKADGSISQWCKIDLETDKIAQILLDNNISVQDMKLVASISKLPFEPDSIIIDDRSDKDPQKKELITALYKYEFLIPRDK